MIYVIRTKCKRPLSYCRLSPWLLSCSLFYIFFMEKILLLFCGIILNFFTNLTFTIIFCIYYNANCRGECIEAKISCHVRGIDCDNHPSVFITCQRWDHASVGCVRHASHAFGWQSGKYTKWRAEARLLNKTLQLVLKWRTIKGGHNFHAKGMLRLLCSIFLQKRALSFIYITINVA